MEENEEMKVSIGLKILCFCIPLVGLIIFACNISKNEKYAKKCGMASLWGLLTPIIALIILLFISAIGMAIFNATKVKQIQKSYNIIVDMYNQESEKDYNYVKVPKVVGKTFMEAKKELEELDLKVEKIEVKSNVIASGIVIKQDITNTVIPKGSTINLYVSIED